MDGSAKSLDLSAFSSIVTDMAENVPGMSWEPALRLVSIQLAAATKENFEGSHTPDGDPWAPLKRPRSRKRDKVKRNPGSTGDKPLRDTNLLMGSVSAGDASKEGSVRELTSHRLLFGSNLFYGLFHQEGTKTKSGAVCIPKREWLGISQSSTEAIGQILEDYAVKVIVSRFPGGG